MPAAPTFIVVTGASSGIGRALARCWAAPGRRIGLLARRAAPLESAAQEVRDRGGEPIVSQCDVTDTGDVERSVHAMLETGQPPDRLVCAAGVLAAGPAHPLPVDELRSMLETNLIGLARVTDAFVPSMLERGGTVLHVASLSALHPFTGIAGYAITKWAVRGYHRALAAQLAGTRVRLAISYPSIVDTPMVHAVQQAHDSGESPLPPIYRAWPARDPERIARKIVAKVERGRRRIFVAPDDAVLDLVLRLAPRAGARLADRLTAMMARRRGA